MRPFGENGFIHNKFFAPSSGMFPADPGYSKLLK
jgi:hypothetical protein